METGRFSGASRIATQLGMALGTVGPEKHTSSDVTSTDKDANRRPTAGEASKRPEIGKLKKKKKV